MKVTVSFGPTGVVVPCKEGWTVRDLIQQATQRYRKLLEQQGQYLVQTHHIEYCDGGILDPDDILSDLVEDKDKLMAVYEEQEAQQRGATSPSLAPSPDLYHSELSAFQPIPGGEIEVNSSALKSSTPLLVRSSSDSALGPQIADSESSLTEDTTLAAHPTVEKPVGVERHQSKHTFNSRSLTRTVEILGEDSPLGIHVVPYCSSLSGRSLGLYIRGVEEESRSRKEGLFQEEECIVKINSTDLMDKTFSQAQEVFRHAMHSSTVRLEVVPSCHKENYEKSLIGQLVSNSSISDGSPRTYPKAKDPPPPVKAKPVFKPPEIAATQLAIDVNPPEADRSRSASPACPGKDRALSSLLLTKKAGRRLRIDLKKGSDGLGFTVVTRDSTVHGPGPILVKNILPRGAAIRDGRLQSGDRILEVNGADISGVGQEDLVCMLRSTRHGESVSLVVLRQEDMFLPREMDEVPSGPNFIVESGKEQLMFEVPLNDTGSAGLGISLKGNKSRETGEDLGIFIKSIIHGGAAYKDGRLRINDQLVAVNGESLLGHSNHEAMETLRRSMSHEGNVRGMIQLVVLRALKDQHGLSPNCSFDGSSHLPGLLNHMTDPAGFISQANGHMSPSTLNNSLHVSNGINGSFHHSGEDADADLYQHQEFRNSKQYSHHKEREASSSAQPQSPNQNPSQDKRHFQHVKASKSMDLGTTQSQQHTVADESNIGALVGNNSALLSPEGIGPTLGLKKSCSLESLQTAISEVNKINEVLPFHRPRPNMVRGRGCNESFRAAIDKSYDGPPEDDDDEGSEHSSGRDTPASGSSRQGAGEHRDEKSKKDMKKKAKTKKKDKNKVKAKEKEKKKADDLEDNEKKSKKIGFGLLRFGKRKEEKKAALQRQKSDVLSDVDLEKMKEERERIELGHPELQDHLQGGGAAPPFPDVEDDESDPNYARIQSFKGRSTAPPAPLSPHSPPYSTVQRPQNPSPQGPSNFHPLHANDATAAEDHLDRLYAKVNKPRAAGTTSPPVPAASNESMDRIQQLRREYQQAMREGMVPPYDDLDQRRRAHDNDRMPMRAVDPRMAPRYEEVERQYASLPRRGPMEPSDYPVPQWSGLYAGAPQPPQGYTNAPTYPSASSQPASFPSYQPTQPYPRPGEHRALEPGYYPHQSSQQRGPLRQDVPPSPTTPLRGLRYDTMTRGAAGGGGYSHMAHQDHYVYSGEQRGQHHQTNPRQKNAMTAAK
ncbi:partitioning defective 3 homolog B isoform X3 [Synchiropus splendidus]|uniref:partitioning defective 3 homolog B isoform X3 n=1 Tax=Synchiropus splendidus TaxID=270530 RepID=UPI00237D9D79|nr:partitioning defective 3 homolog B isoform X3 [Synchiropus splendidus]